MAATMVRTFLLLLIIVPTCQAFWSSKKEKRKEFVAPDYSVIKIPLPSKEVPVEYGVDISFPIHHDTVSKNYAWLPHNLDPSIPTPKEFVDVPVQPLGDRQKVYDDFLQSCIDAFGKSKGRRCRDTGERKV